MRREPCRSIIAGALAAIVTAAPAGAGIERAGTTAAGFLSVGCSPGVLAMGGAGLSLEGGLAAFDWNPATLARIGRTEVGFSHAALGEQNAQEWGAFGSRLRFAGLFGAITGRFQNEGSFEGRDALNNPTGTLGASSMALGVGVARALGPFATAGLGLKYASENLGGVRGSGVTFDAGLQVQSHGFGLGAAAQNVFGQMRYEGAVYGFPASYGFGASYQHAASGLRVALDMNFPAAYYHDVRGGVEWLWNERLALRAGYRAELGAAPGDPAGGPTFGMGAGAGGMWLDYGYLVGGDGPGQHRIGITFHPGAPALPPDGPEHRGSGYGHASPDAMPASGTDAAARASAKPQTSAPGTAPAPSSAPVPSSAPASAAAGSAARTPAGAPASASAPPSAGRAPTKAPAPASAPASSAARAPSPAAPVAAAVPPASAPPTYAQRAKAASGTAQAASDRRSAALEPSSGATPPAPVVPRVPAPAAAKRDSVPAPKAGPPATTSAPTVGTTPTAAAPAKLDSVAVRPAAPKTQQGPRPQKVRVRNRQTMADIAREYGTSVPAIMMENNMVTDRVRAGQVLKLPRK